MKSSEFYASQIYFWLKDIPSFKNFISKNRGFIKLHKNDVKHIFQFLMLSTSSIKEQLHKPLKIQWNITETLPGKLKRKISWALSYKILPPEITRMQKIAILGALWGPGNQCGIQCFFTILWISEAFSIYLLVKNSFNFKLFFHLFWIYFRGYHQKEHFTFRLP